MKKAVLGFQHDLMSRLKSVPTLFRRRRAAVAPMLSPVAVEVKGTLFRSEEPNFTSYLQQPYPDELEKIYEAAMFRELETSPKNVLGAVEQLDLQAPVYAMPKPLAWPVTPEDLHEASELLPAVDSDELEKIYEEAMFRELETSPENVKRRMLVLGTMKPPDLPAPQRPQSTRHPMDILPKLPTPRQPVSPEDLGDEFEHLPAAHPVRRPAIQPRRPPQLEQLDRPWVRRVRRRRIVRDPEGKSTFLLQEEGNEGSTFVPKPLHPHSRQAFADPRLFAQHDVRRDQPRSVGRLRSSVTRPWEVQLK